MAEVRERMDIAGAVLEAQKAKPASREAVIRLLDKYSDGKFSESQEMKRGTMDALLDKLATATDPDTIKATVDTLMKLAERIK